MKTLVYYTVGYNSRFSEAVELSIETLRASASVFPDILILCDQSIRPCFSIDNVKFLEFPDIDSGRKASRRKLSVFEYPNIWSYDAVVFIDADTIVHRDINSFVSPGVEEGVLYVGRERSMRGFKRGPWSLENLQFDQATIDKLESKGTYPFNAGFFLFKPDVSMKAHFDEVLRLMDNHRSKMGEQRYMNHYFPLYGEVDQSRITKYNYAMPYASHALEPYPDKVVHFLGAGFPVYRKIYKMKRYVEAYMPDLVNISGHDKLCIDVSWRVEDTDDADYLLKNETKSLSINDSAATVITMCDGKHTIPTIIDQLVDETNADYLTVENDVLGLLDGLKKMGVVKRLPI